MQKKTSKINMILIKKVLQKGAKSAPLQRGISPMSAPWTPQGTEHVSRRPRETKISKKVTAKLQKWFSQGRRGHSGSISGFRICLHTVLFSNRTMLFWVGQKAYHTFFFRLKRASPVGFIPNWIIWNEFAPTMRFSAGSIENFSSKPKTITENRSKRQTQIRQSLRQGKKS